MICVSRPQPVDLFDMSMPEGIERTPMGVIAFTVVIEHVKRLVRV